MQELIKAIQDLGCVHGTQTVLRDLLMLTACGLSTVTDFARWFERTERLQNATRAYTSEELSKLYSASNRIVELCTAMVLKGDWRDVLGELYMNLFAGNKRLGQFFTPFDVLRLMSRLCIGESFTCSSEKYQTLCEPACGSGGSVLAVLEHLDTAGINYTEKLLIDCTDIDINCVLMTYIQLSLVGASAVIKHGDTLTQIVYDVWYTPAYLLQRYKWRKK